MAFNGYFQFVPDSGTSWNELEMAKLKEQTELFLTNAGYPILWDKRKTFSQLWIRGQVLSMKEPVPRTVFEENE